MFISRRSIGGFHVILGATALVFCGLLGGCVSYDLHVPGHIPKLSVDLVDDQGLPLDGVTVRVDHHGGITRTTPVSQEYLDSVKTGSPLVVNRHFEYEPPWGSEWVQLVFTKTGYFEASRDFPATYGESKPMLMERVVLHKRN